MTRDMRTVPYKVPRDSKSDPLQAVHMKPEEVETHLEPIETLTAKWRDLAIGLTKAVLTEVSKSL